MGKTKTKTEDCGKVKTPLFYWNTGFMDSMLTADNLLRERLNMLDDNSLNIYRLLSYIRNHNIDEVKKYCNKDNIREELRELKYDSYHPIYVACREYEINILTYLLELNIFDDWQVNEMHKLLYNKFTTLLEKDEKVKKITDEVKQKQDIMLNMIKYYANTRTKRARGT